MPALLFLLAMPGYLHAQGYGGPSMLSRGGNRPGQRGKAPVNLTYYGAVRGVYETGLLPVSLGEDGVVQNQNFTGVQVEAGLYGTRSFKKSVMGIDYRGDYRTSNGSASRRGYNGSNQALALDYEYQYSRRLVFFAAETAGTTNRAFGGFSAPAFSDNQNVGVPLDEVFDSRVYYTQTSGSVLYRKTARTSYAGSYGYFIQKRPDSRLVSTTGHRANAVYQYRISSRTSLGAMYTYSRYAYPRVFGGANINGLVATFERVLNKSMDITAAAGVLRYAVEGNRTVELSPEIAEILGVTRGIEAYRRVSYSPNLSFGFNYKQERGVFRLAAVTGVSPGNGVFLASRRDTATGGYSFTGIRRMSIGISAGWSKIGSRGPELEPLTIGRAGAGFNYRLIDHVDLSGQFDRRLFNSSGLNGRNGYSITFGVSVTPSRLPLSIW